MAKGDWTVRRSQLITTYGVGAVVAMGDESVMVAGLDRWPPDQLNLHEARLEEKLRVEGFRLPRATEKGDDIPVVRFPKWASCPSCHRLAHVSQFCGPHQYKCNRCDRPLIPSRFVVACQRGHIDDFPYFNWVHRGTNHQSETHLLSLETKGSSASLRDILVNCSCGASRDMDGSFGQSALRFVVTCQRNRPWLLDKDDTPCSEIPRVLQRGGSSVWFPVVRSAISIPPWSDEAFRLIERHWSFIRTLSAETLPEALKGYFGDKELRFPIEKLVEVVLDRKGRERQPRVIEDEELRFQEYEALLQGSPESSPEDEFVCEQAAGIGAVTTQWFDRVMVVPRLREVRALHRFTRVFPDSSGTPDEYRVHLSAQHLNWLPAVEVLGEGVFFRLDLDRVREWESRPAVVRRAEVVDARYREKCRNLGVEPEIKITARLLMIHTLAHVIIDQWSLDSGYPAAALRERLYVSDRMAGVLVYTATGDSAGSLGGVVGQALPELLDQSLQLAVDRASWCSADPVCYEAHAQGTDSLNLAACHACVLLPEVCCEQMNQFLDRVLLVGSPSQDDVGFLQRSRATS